MPKKAGANKLDQAFIKRNCVEGGMKAEEAAKTLNMEVSVVKNFIKAYTKKAEPAPKTAAPAKK